MRSAPAFALLLATFACATGHDAEGPVPYRMVANSTSGVEMPRVRLPGRPEVEERVNDQLDSLAASLVCEDAQDGTYDTTALVTHAADDVFSVQVGVSYYCGGAYPVNHADSSVSFDLRTGESVRFRALFTDYQRDRSEIARAYLKSLAPEDLEGCEDVLTVEGLGEQTFAYTISARGLRLEPSFPHVVEVCNLGVNVAFDELRPFAAPAGILARVAGSAQSR